VLVVSVGTGGTLTGAGHYLKEQNPHLHILAVEPTAMWQGVNPADPLAVPPAALSPLTLPLG
jgi:cysteine synthase